MIDDITRNYHKGHPLSEEANSRTNKARDTARIHAFVSNCGAHGATSDDANYALWGGVAHQTASARFTEMKASGALIDTGRKRMTRKNCPAAVFVAAPNWRPDKPDPPVAPPDQDNHLCPCREYGRFGIKRKDGSGLYDFYCRDHVLLADPNFFAYARATEARRPDGAGATETQSPR